MLFVAGLFLLLLTAGCEIEKTEPPQTGSVLISLKDTSDNPLSGARIRVDGRDTPRLTPATLTGLSVGTHSIGAYKPGFTVESVHADIVLDQVIPVSLTAIPSEEGAINLSGAPEGTVLIINNLPVGAVPTTPETPTIFERLGIGTFQVSAYLPGHATELPSQWTVRIASGNPVILMPLFAPVPVEPEIGSLAPPFELPCDWDSSLYRLQDYRGKVVLVTFFFCNCSACLEELPYIASIYKDPDYADRVQFLGVDFTDPYAAFAHFRAEHPALDITFPLLHDAQRAVYNAYNIVSCPANFFVDPTGRLRLITGAISEPLLRQTLDQLLETADSPTVNFVMQDTLIHYANGDSTYAFHGVLANLLAAERTMVIQVDPIQTPDTNRQFSVCTYNGCYPLRSGSFEIREYFPAMLRDTVFSIDIYNYVTDWSAGFPGSADSALWGDYTVQVTVFPADNAEEQTVYRLHLDDLNSVSIPMIRPRVAVKPRSSWLISN